MESPANAKASFIVPCFNLGRYLDEAVESILAQTNQDFEILIVDDGSTDVETRRVLQDYRRPRTRVIRSGKPRAAGGEEPWPRAHHR